MLDKMLVHVQKQHQMPCLCICGLVPLFTAEQKMHCFGALIEVQPFTCLSAGTRAITEIVKRLLSTSATRGLEQTCGVCMLTPGRQGVADLSLHCRL